MHNNANLTEKYLEWVNRLSYKPEWEFSIFPEDNNIFNKNEEFRLVVVMRTPSSISNKTITFGQYIPLPKNIGFQEFCDAAYDLVQFIENHEIEEWFKVDGVPPYWPHKDLDYKTLVKEKGVTNV